MENYWPLIQHEIAKLDHSSGNTECLTKTKTNFVLCRDEEFSVGSVFESDVIHANKKDIACIFRVSCTGTYIEMISQLQNQW